MRNLTICTVALMAVLFVLAPTAGADPPTREFIPASDFTISGSCSFDVGVHIVTNNEYGITFANGATLVTGALKVTLTNLSDPSKSITLNIPGPGVFTATSDGGLRIDARGPWLFFYTGVLLYSTGYSTFTVSASGVFSLSQQGGTSTNLCAVLA
jgi:uncharacterized protein YaiE (UPF0345 family)